MGVGAEPMHLPNVFIYRLHAHLVTVTCSVANVLRRDTHSESKATPTLSFSPIFFEGPLTKK